MGDDPQTIESSKIDRKDDNKDHVSTSSTNAPSQDTRREVAASAPFQSQLPSMPLQVPSGQLSNQYTMAHGQSPSAFNVAGMAAALPDYGASQSPGYVQSPSLAAGRSPQMPSYPIQPGMPYPPGAPYSLQPGYGVYGQAPQYGPQFGQPAPGQPHVAQMGYPSFPAAQRSPGHIPQYPQSPVQYYYPPPPGTYGGPPRSPTTYQAPGPSTYPAALRTGAPAIVSDSMGDRSSVIPYGMGTPDFEEGGRAFGSSAKAAIPRGPPRKPRQSGHALWVGNLPPGATIMDLKNHFSKDFARDIESLFLISKSNCAFVNYRTEEACTRAMQRFHDSRFQGVRLVCRPRKPSASGTSTAVASSSSPSKSPQHKSASVDGAEESEEEEKQVKALEESTDRVAERFFIVKSLTLQDLEQSVRNGIWATQSHNEYALNKAYNNAGCVYLVFSANKSGEYFGYARMTSSIAENAAEVLGAIPRTDVSEYSDVPKEITTPATDVAPKGRIIDDSARGTIFWEAEVSDDDAVEDDSLDAEPSDSEPLTWGKPFKIEWISTSRVPFYRTRGLRNPWNANREVKIARDGTELEPMVGKRLLQLFHRPSVSGPSSANPGPSYAS